MTTPLVEFINVSKGFPGVQALSEVSLDLRPGEVHALIGENGAGKSTLMNILAGELQPDGGEIRIEGAALRLSSPQAARVRGIAVVFQELSLCPNLSVGENVMMTTLAARHALSHLDRAGAAQRARSLLARLGMPEIDPTTPVRALTVAQMQLVEIARAISLEARVLVLDEPNSALSPRESERLFEVVAGLRSQGVSIVYVSHHLEEVLRIADRITVLRDGHRVAHYESLAEVRVSDLVTAMVGRDLGKGAQHGLTAAAPKEGPVLRVRGLKVPGEIRGIDLDLAPGEILGVAGLPDSGKDSLADALFGLAPRAGQVTVAGVPLRPEAPQHAIAAGLALIPADRRRGGALLAMTVAENMVSASLRHFLRWGVLRRSAVRRTAGTYAQRLDARIAGLAQRMDTLSGGNQQKIILARGLMTRPRVLILHEPTRGIDVGAKAEIYSILRSLAAEGLAVLLVSSELPEIVMHSSRVLVMAEGRITADLHGPAITEQNVMTAATGQQLQAAE
jgi:ABC-type sugar transport system ATPase subunit